MKMTEPKLIKAGDKRLKLGLSQMPPKVDCRVIWEENYKELKRVYDLRKANNWIAVKDKMPVKEGNYYLAFYANCCITKALYHGGSLHAVEDGWQDETPTHWMPLPKPPAIKIATSC